MKTVRYKRNYPYITLLVLCIFSIYNYDSIVTFICGLNQSTDRYLTGCIFNTITGIPCPLCGITRSMYITLHGEFIGAFFLHPLGPIILMILIYILITKILTLFSTRIKVIQIPINNRTITIICCIILGVWIFRLLFLDLANHPFIS